MARHILAAVVLLTAALVSVSGVSAQPRGMGLFSVTDNAALGQILADSAGMTLYTWAGDAPGTSSCSGGCATAWPPYLVDEGTATQLMAMSTRVGALARDDGTYQIAIDGQPLYYFQRDTAPGDANGEGSNGFGARWSVISVDPAMTDM
jgi:predicted lipoprotein with Yx(FWY)xxD motif